MSDEPTEAARAAWYDGDLHELVAAYRRGERTPQQAMAEQQQALSATGDAVGQCACGAYRLDGQPPILHNDGCVEKPDMPPIYDL